MILGLDFSGKTSLLYYLKLGEIITTIPTIGFNVENITSDKIELTLWDVGGSPKIVPLWKHYFENTDVVVFVIDASAPHRYPEVKEAL